MANLLTNQAELLAFIRFCVGVKPPTRYRLRQLFTQIASPWTTHASVLVPFYLPPSSDGECYLIFTKRSATLKHHGGEISFPGGKQEPEDHSPIDTAIRETMEEIGLQENVIHPYATLPPTSTLTGYTVTPTLAIIDKLPSNTQSSPAEVESLLAIPIHWILNKDHYRFFRIKKYLPLRLTSIDYPPYHIWGYTAEILFFLAHSYTQFKEA